MHETDRGAYTPQTDAPLAFDARRPAERRPLPMTLIASAAVLVAIVAALVLAYRGGVRGSENPKPVGEPVGAIKTAAAPEAPAAADPASTMDVYAAQNVPATAPNFAPPPEAPLARPVPAPAPQLQVRTVDSRMRIEAPEPAASAPPPAPASRPVQTAAAPPARSAVPAPAATTLPARQTATAPTVTTATRTTTTATTATIAAPAPAAAKAGGASVQIGAFSSDALAQKGFADSAALVSAAGHGRAVERVERDGKTFYRATLTGFADRAAAKAFCDRLAAKGGRCIVKG